jgi:transposase
MTTIKKLAHDLLLLPNELKVEFLMHFDNFSIESLFENKKLRPFIIEAINKKLDFLHHRAKLSWKKYQQNKPKTGQFLQQAQQDALEYVNYATKIQTEYNQKLQNILLSKSDLYQIVSEWGFNVQNEHLKS